MVAKGVFRAFALLAVAAPAAAFVPKSFGVKKVRRKQIPVVEKKDSDPHVVQIPSIPGSTQTLTFSFYLC